MRRAAAALSVITSLACAPQAPAVSVVVGPDPLAAVYTPAGEGCYVIPSTQPCDYTAIITSLPGSARVSVPADGVITSWRVIAYVTDDGKVYLRVARPAANGQYEMVATSAAGTSFNGTTPNPASIPVRAGDLIGGDGRAIGNDAEIETQGYTEGFGEAKWSPHPADGSTSAPTSTLQRAPTINATVDLFAPVVASVSPASGSAAGGETVTITGDHLANASAVHFGPNSAPIVSNTNTAIRVTAPAGSGTVDVTVSAPGGDSIPSDTARYTYPPAAGPTDGGGGNAPGPTQAPGVLDKIAPVISAFVVSPSTFQAANTGPAFVAAVGGRVVYRLSEPSRVTFTVQRKAAGRKKGKRCVAPNRAPHGKRCNRFTAVRGNFGVDGVAGLNTFRFMARLGGKALKPGNHVLVAVARDAAGNSSKPVRHPFRIKK
jgi:hypothetical protein